MSDMKLQTHKFGEIEFEDDNIIIVEKGLFGFEHLQKYLLIKTENELFYWFNSIEEPEIAFPLVGISVIDDTFPKESDFESFGIVTLNADPLKITVNMKAPLYVNQDGKIGRQKIIDSEKYSVNYNLFVE